MVQSMIPVCQQLIQPHFKCLELLLFIESITSTWQVFVKVMLRAALCVTIIPHLLPGNQDMEIGQTKKDWEKKNRSSVNAGSGQNYLCASKIHGKTHTYNTCVITA